MLGHDERQLLIEGMARCFAASFKAQLEQNKVENINIRYFDASNSKKQQMIKQGIESALEFFLSAQEIALQINNDDYSKINPFDLPEE